MSRRYKISLSPEHQYSVIDLTTNEMIQGKIISVYTVAQRMNRQFNLLSLFFGQFLNRIFRIYPNLTDEEIMEIWRKNGQHCALLGTKMHSVLEKYLKNLR